MQGAIKEGSKFVESLGGSKTMTESFFKNPFVNNFLGNLTAKPSESAGNSVVSQTIKNLVGEILKFRNPDGWSLLYVISQYNDKIPFIKFLEFLLSKLNMDLFKELLLQKDRFGRTFLHALSWMSNGVSITDLIDFILNKLDRDLALELLKALNLEGWTFLHFLSKLDKNSKFPFLKLLGMLLDALDPKFLQELFLFKTESGWTFLHFLSNGNIPIFELLQLMISKLKGFVVELLKAQNMEKWTFLHFLSQKGDHNELLKMFEMLLEEIDVKSLKELLLSKTDKGLNFLQFLIEGKIPFLNLLQLLVNKLKGEFLSDLLKAPNTNNWTILHLLSKNGDQNELVKLFGMLIGGMDTKSIQELLLLKTDNGFNFLHILIESKVPFMELLQLLTSNLKGNFICDLLKAQNTENWTILHILSKNGDQNQIMKLFGMILDGGDTKSMQELLLFKTNKGWTFLHFLSEGKVPFLDVLNLLFSKLNGDFMKELLKAQNLENWTFMHLFCKYSTNQPADSLMKMINNSLGRDYVTNLLAMRTNFNSTCLHFLSEFNENTTPLEFLQLVSNHVDKKSLQNILLDQDNNKNTFLMILNQKPDKSINYVELLKWLAVIFDKEFMTKLLGSTNSKGNNIFLDAISDKSTVDKAQNVIEQVLGKDFFKNLIAEAVRKPI